MGFQPPIEPSCGQSRWLRPSLIRLGFAECPVWDDSSGTMDAGQRPPADNVLIKVGVGAVAGTKDAPVAPRCDVVGFPNADRHRKGGRCLLILDPEDHRSAVPWCQPG